MAVAVARSYCCALFYTWTWETLLSGQETDVDTDQKLQPETADFKLQKSVRHTIAANMHVIKDIRVSIHFTVVVEL